jgi:hypothetical protein
VELAYLSRKSFHYSFPDLTLIWFLTFSNPKQAYDMLAKKEISDENRIIKRDEIRAEHLMDLLQMSGMESLDQGEWAWEGGRQVPATGVTSVVRK